MLYYFQMSNFSDWLTTKMAQKGIKPADLAKRMKKDQSVISRILSGERRPDIDTIVNIADALDVRPEEVFLEVVGIQRKEDTPAKDAAHLIGLLSDNRKEQVLEYMRFMVDIEEKQKSK